ncbi:MAG: tetratricopeptide repeat protein [Acidobacteriota bacterium]
MKARSERDRSGLFLCALAVASIAPFAPAIRGDFVWDDRPLILDSQATASVRPISRFFARDFWAEGGAPRQSGYYRPLTLLSFAVERRLFGAMPLPFHVTNLLLHACSTLLGYTLLRRLGAAVQAALIAAFLFAVHPVHVESVAWISGRTDLLASTLAIAALLCAASPRFAIAFALAPVLFFASLLSKESCALLPLLALTHRAFRPRLARASALFAAAIPYALLRLAALPLPALHGAPFLSRAALAGKLVAVYLGKLVAPSSLPLDLSVATPGALRILWAGVIPALLAAAIAAAWCQSQAAPLLFLLPLVPTLGLVPISDTSAIRFLYLPALGFAGIAAELFSRVPRRAGAIAVVAIVAALGVLSAMRTRDFRTDETLFRAERALSPGSVRMAIDFAEVLRRQHREPEALAVYEELRPGGDIRIALAIQRTHRDQGDLDAAADDAKDALARFPDDARAHGEAGLTYAAQGFVSLAEEELGRAVAIDPDAAVARVNLAMLLARQRRIDEARRIVEEGLSRRPGNAELLRARALIGPGASDRAP